MTASSNLIWTLRRLAMSALGNPHCRKLPVGQDSVSDVVTDTIVFHFQKADFNCDPAIRKSGLVAAIRCTLPKGPLRPDC